MKTKVLPLLMIFGVCFSISSCNYETTGGRKDNDVITLNVYNCADYICETESDEQTGEIIKGTMDQFEDYAKEVYGANVNVVYSTFETLEDMYNQLVAGGIQYDLICPSEYMIEKLIMNDMLETLDGPISNYQQYGSNYIKEKFDTITTHSKDGSKAVFKDYAIPYMWGTIGYMYDPNPSNNELGLDIDSDVSSIDVIWNENYKNKSSLKDSIRDSYIVGAIHVYKHELDLLKEMYENGYIDAKEYNKRITEVVNRCDDTTIAMIESALKQAKENVYEFEVDTGKEHIVKGDYWINCCWSGDAVYSLDLAEEEGVTLCFKVPEEASNVWFDGWVMPKGANKLWAQRLMDFLCDPSIASQNMNSIGYTSAIAGQDMWELVKDWYDSDSKESSEYDLTYFFENSGIVDEDGNEITNFIIHTEEVNRQLYAQYPDLKTISRCAVMQDFGDQYNAVSESWIRVKGNQANWVIFVVLGFVVALIIFVEVKSSMNRRARKNRARK